MGAGVAVAAFGDRGRPGRRRADRRVIGGCRACAPERGPALRRASGGLLIEVGAIHLDLYLTGYRLVPTIGWLFLLQVIAASGLGVVMLASGARLPCRRRRLRPGDPGRLPLSLWIGLFGFTEVRTTAGIVAGVIEVADCRANHV